MSETTGEQPSTGEAAPAPPLTVRRVVRVVATVALVVASTIWDEALLSAPVVLSTARVGAWPTFVVFAVVYGLAGFVVTLTVVRGYQRRMDGRPGRLQRWVEHEAESRRYRWARRLLLDSGWAGFVVACFVLGPIVVTWLLVATGRVRDDVARVAAASSAVFAITFVGPYCGVGRLLTGG